MSTAVEEKPKTKSAEQWRPPGASVGDDVLWYPDGKVGSNPHMGKVIQIGQWALTLQTYGAGGQYGHERTGVRHVDDPHLAARPNAAQQNGAWDFTAKQKLLASLRGRLETLEAKLANAVPALTKRVETLEKKPKG